MLTFPLAPAVFADLLPVVDVRFRMAENQEQSGLGSGQILTSELAPSLWEADVTLAPLKHGLQSQIQAKFEALDGSIRSFYFGDPFHRYPQEDPDGSKLGSATPTIHSIDASRRAIRITELPASYKLTAGDFIAFDYGNPARRALHRIVETATASGTGLTPLFEIRPTVMTGVTTGLAVTLIKPVGKFILKPKTLNLAMPARMRRQISFSAIQRL